MKHDCPTCRCETPEEREARIRADEDKRQREERERQFAKRHSVLTDDDLAWARSQLRGAR